MWSYLGRGPCTTCDARPAHCVIDIQEKFGVDGYQSGTDKVELVWQLRAKKQIISKRRPACMQSQITSLRTIDCTADSTAPKPKLTRLGNTRRLVMCIWGQFWSITGTSFTLFYLCKLFKRLCTHLYLSPSSHWSNKDQLKRVWWDNDSTSQE